MPQEEVRSQVNGIRICLRKICFRDLPHYYDAFNNQDITYYWESGMTWNRDYLLMRFDQWIKRSKENKLSWWSIFLKNDNFVGSIGLNYENKEALSVCIFILPQYQKSWIAGEALVTLLKHLHKTKSLPSQVTFTFTIHRENKNSLEFAKNFGFTQGAPSQNLTGRPNYRYTKTVNLPEIINVFSEYLNALQRQTNNSSIPLSPQPLNYFKENLLSIMQPQSEALYYIKSIDVITSPLVVGKPFTVTISLTEFAQSVDLEGHFIVIRMYDKDFKCCELTSRKGSDYRANFQVFHVPSNNNIRTYHYENDVITVSVISPRKYQSPLLYIEWYDKLKLVEYISTPLSPMESKKRAMIAQRNYEADDSKTPHKKLKFQKTNEGNLANLSELCGDIEHLNENNNTHFIITNNNNTNFNNFNNFNNFIENNNDNNNFNFNNFY